MRLAPRLLACAAGCAALLLVARPIAATTVVLLDDAALARGARTILHGDVLSKESFVAAEGGRIYTEYRFAVRDLIKGTAGTDGAITFREWGGQVGDVRYWIPGLPGYDVGEEVVAFLGDADARTGAGFTFGFAQGKFKVDRDRATGKASVKRNLGGLKLVRQPGGPGGAVAPPPAVDERDPGDEPGRDLDAFKTAIRAEVKK